MDLSYYRVESGMTRKEIAEKIGVSASTYSRWETGSRKPNREMAQKLSRLFGVPAHDLSFGKENGEEKEGDGPEDAPSPFGLSLAASDSLEYNEPLAECTSLVLEMQEFFSAMEELKASLDIVREMSSSPLPDDPDEAKKEKERRKHALYYHYSSAQSYLKRVVSDIVLMKKKEWDPKGNGDPQ
jgi:transcriptional regulator with XRE-family HTH domain